MARGMQTTEAMSTANSTQNPAPKNPQTSATEAKSDGAIDWKKGIETLEQAKDEIALKLHLASMDAKDEWNKLETSIREVHHFHSKPETPDQEKHGVVQDLLGKVKAFGEKLKS